MLSATWSSVPTSSRPTSTTRRRDASSNGCGWPVALDARRRRDVAVGLLRGRAGDRRRGEGATRLCLLRRSPGGRLRAIVLALATNTWHAYNDFGGPNLYTGGTQVSMQRPMAAGLPAQAARQGSTRHRHRRARSPERRPCRLHPLNHLSRSPVRRVGPTGSSRSSSGPRVRASRSVCAPTPTSSSTPRCSTVRACSSRSATTSTGRAGMRDTVEAFIARGGNAAFFSGNTSLVAGAPRR